ncbi:MAG: Pyrrolo-quinoline quinone [Pedosphaera sp.]|nr:Pyrrolo-quinoline quinone [Pedosphaera sp.]
MNIKIQCACGTKFSFELEPVNGRMPMNVNCPGCNTSALDLANAEIKRQLAAAPPAAAAIPVAAAVALPPTPPPPPAAVPGQPQISIPVRAVAPPTVAPAPVVAAAAPVVRAPAAVPAPPPASAASLVPKPPTASALKISKPAGEHHAPAPEPAPEPAAAVAVGGTATATAGGELCHRHKTEPAATACCVCGKQICLKCMEQFGHVCSVYCRQQATAKRIYVPVYANQKSVIQGKSLVLGKRITFAVVASTVVFMSLWIWYAWFARNPKVVFSLEIPKSDSRVLRDDKPDAYYQLIGPNQMLSIKSKKLYLTEVIDGKQIWSARLQSEADEAAVKAARENNERIIKLTPKVIDTDTGHDRTVYPKLDPLGYQDDYFFARPRVMVTSNDVWVSFSDRLARFDRQTGSVKDVGIKDKIESVTYNGNTILVVSREPSARELLTQITLPDATMQSEEITPAKVKPLKPAGKATNSTTKAAKSATTGPTNKTSLAKSAKPANKALQSPDGADKLPADKLKAAAVQAAPPMDTGADDDDDGRSGSYFYASGLPGFIATGPNVVQFQTAMIEHKTIAHEAMKPKTKSIMESGNLTAGQSLDATQELLNDMQRQTIGGMAEEDVSRYQVTLHRRFANGIPDWTGEVVGPPQFFALKTMDMVAAGNSIQLFDKNNKKLWEAKMTYTIPSHSAYDEEYSPFLETKGALYVADQGILTRYDSANGNVRWRLNSVGISRIQEDPSGDLYINTTTAGPDSIKYSQQVNVHDKIRPVIMKVDQKTGKVLWRLESVGEECLISGKFVYATRVSQSMAWLKLEEGPDTHFNINLLNPSTGSVIWNFHQGNRRLIKTDVQKNWILLHFDDRVMVLKFFSL